MNNRYPVLRAFIVLLKVLSGGTMLVSVFAWIILLYLLIAGPPAVAGIENPSIESVGGVPLPPVPRSGIRELDAMADSMMGLLRMPLPVREVAAVTGGVLLLAGFARAVGTLIGAVALWAFADFLSSWLERVDAAYYGDPFADAPRRLGPLPYAPPAPSPYGHRYWNEPRETPYTPPVRPGGPDPRKLGRP